MACKIIAASHVFVQEQEFHFQSLLLVTYLIPENVHVWGMFP